MEGPEGGDQSRGGRDSGPDWWFAGEGGANRQQATETHATSPGAGGEGKHARRH